jgi:predicted transcriptional regulator YdeE
MEKIITNLEAFKLVGITTRTNNQSEMDPRSAKISDTIKKFIPENISDRKNSGTTFCVYTNYENDFTGDYTYFIGVEVHSFNHVSQALETLVIPAQKYVKFTSQPGVMPDICIKMWQDIWKMSAYDLGGERAYISDFEVYDERTTDPKRAVIDIYIGIK